MRARHPETPTEAMTMAVRPTAYAYAGLLEAANAIRSQETSAVDLATAELERISALDPQLGSFVSVTADLALRQAAEADAEVRDGCIRSRIHGVPIAIKDVVDVAGLPTVAGMPMHRSRVATTDATVYRRLRAAGAVLLGKLHLTEAAYGEYRPPFTPPRNPWQPDRWPGASSSGSGVAVAAGLCFGALGSDTGGSIRTPSAANGVTGIRPTWGRVSRAGVFELAGSFDQIGPMARSAADAGALLAVIAGSDPADPTASLATVPDYLAGLDAGGTGLRVGVDPSWLATGLDPETASAVTSAIETLRGLGAALHEVTVPGFDAVVPDWFTITCVEAARAHRATFPSRRAEYGEAFARALETGHSTSAIEFAELLRRRREFRGRMAGLFSTIDLLVTPVLPFATPTVAAMSRMDDELIRGLHRFTCPFSMSSSPTLTLPVGSTSDGMPIGMQLVSRHFDEALLVRAGHAFQQATAWHLMHPPL